MKPTRIVKLPVALTLASAFALALALLLIDDAPAQVNKQPTEVASKATPVATPDFLKIPAGLDPKTFTVAKTPPTIDVCFFEGLADKGKGTLWSSWGDGCFASNGKYYTSVGDHLGKDANSYVYEYDPATRVLRRVVDV